MNFSIFEGDGGLGGQAVIGTAQICANFLGQYTQDSIANLVRNAMLANNWDVLGIKVDTNGIMGFASVCVNINLFSTFDTDAIANMFRDDMMKQDWGSVVSGVTVNILTRNGTANPSPVGGGNPSGAGSRTVIARVTGTINILANFTSQSVGNDVKAFLISQGWVIPSVTQETTNWYPHSPQSFLITAQVENQYSDQAVTANLISQLSTTLLSGVQVAIVSTNPTYQSGGPPGDPNAKGNSPGWDAFWLGLGLTTVPTIGTVAVIGALGVVLLLKR